jgi:hypothetical protein
MPLPEQRAAFARLRDEWETQVSRSGRKPIKAKTR